MINAMLYSMTDTDLESSIFLTRLCLEQKSYLNSILPKTYSLQQHQVLSVGPIKNMHHRKINFIHKQENCLEKDEGKIKRRKNRTNQEFPHEEKRNCLGKKQQIAKKAVMIKKLKKHETSWPFRVIPDNQFMTLSNGTQTVHTPMDLQTIDDKIKNDKYEHPSQIERDINQILINSYKTNYKNNEYFQATTKFQYYYLSLLHQKQQSIPKNQFSEKQKTNQDVLILNKQQEKGGQISQLQKDLTSLLKRANQLSTQKQVRQKPIYISAKLQGNISIKQKRQLAQEIKTIDQRHLGRIYQIIKSTAKDSNDLKIDVKTQILSVDVEKLENRTVRELQNYIKLQKNSVVHERQESFIDSHENQYTIC